MSFNSDEFNALIKEYLETENEYHREFLGFEINNMVKEVAWKWLHSNNYSYKFYEEDMEEIVNDVALKVSQHLAVDEKAKKKEWLRKITENTANDYQDHIKAQKRDRRKELFGDDEFWAVVDGLQYQTGKVDRSRPRTSNEDIDQKREKTIGEKGKTEYITTSHLSFEVVLENIFKMRSEPKSKIAFLLRISRTAVFDSYPDMGLDIMKEVVEDISSLDREEEIRNVFEQEFGKEDSFYIMKTLERIFKYAENKEICSIRENVEPIWKEQIREKLEKEAEEHTILKSIYEVINRDPIEEVLEGKEHFKAATLAKNATVFALRRKIPAEVFKALDEQLKAEKDGVIVGKTLIHFSDRDVKDSASYIKKQITKKYMS